MKTMSADAVRGVVGGGDTPCLGDIQTTACVGAIGAGAGAAKAIEAAPGGLGRFGPAAPAIGSAYAVGAAASGAAGYSAGTLLYQHNDMVKEVANGAVEDIMENGFWNTVWEGVTSFFGIESKDEDDLEELQTKGK